jgi:DNA polymerase III epsilon subunit-like protein
MRWLVFDTETNGLPAAGTGRTCEVTKETCHRWPDVVQISWLIYDDAVDKVYGETDIVVRLPPGVAMNQAATLIHGITEKRNKQGVSAPVAFDTFNAACDAVQCIVGHNLLFDKNVMQASALRIGIRSGLASPKGEFCTMESTKGMCALRTASGWIKYPRLEELHALLFGCVPEGLHDSLVDTRACFRCFYYLMHKVDPIGKRRLLPWKHLPTSRSFVKSKYILDGL